MDDANGHVYDEVHSHPDDAFLGFSDDDKDLIPAGVQDTIIVERDGETIETYNPETGETTCEGACDDVPDDSGNVGDEGGGDDGGD